MASHRRPKQPSRTRVSVLTVTAAAAVALTSQAAHADPQSSKKDVKEKVDKLYEDAEAATEKYNGAKEKQSKLQTQVENLQGSVARGQGDLNKMRNKLGSMATAQYRSGAIDPSVQLFLSSDPDNYLDRASAMDQLSTKQASALKKIQAKQRTLAQQRKEASGKLKDLASTRKELGDKKSKIQGKLSKAQSLLNSMSAKERAKIAAKQKRADRASSDRADLGNSKGSGRAGAAFAAAKTKIGSPYVWGATGPSSFDCSGLTSWAYKQAGVSLPRTSQAQASAGTRIPSQSQLKVGDLVMFYDDLHHIGLYAGNGQVLHAPKPGANVRFESINNMPFMYGVRV
ncbi:MULTISPECIES: NlpC/P60 family protein [unclassified Streptomyces]|uniref:C40 family peptidase n=1 Tax=unclassified Streptomyces TaxID=2593676 RepID=UPI002DDADAC2|nr:MULTISPECIES: NlpC/P60 family protein [unclassified Streptomyces]WSA95279.1 NlpC/P60 family protein [Streptomyces sp. NBC_01795]WSB79697.1 NlpC/P60 family protein [Streptomyces sp. NBC_01775]WSS12097.1 NlpC/P60 family protein [Streptomyces sp. NBC_01186]WSS40810.1 NlpC/P60 family protein [Streptomyces sp. NBC_01187]